MDGPREPKIVGPLAAAPNGLYIFSNAACSLQSSAPNSLIDDKALTSEKCLAVTLMYSYKSGKKVLFLEAGKDFVDIVLSLLTLPIGSVIKLFKAGSDSAKLHAGIFKVFNSVEKMEGDRFVKSRKSLLEPEATSGFGSKLLQVDPHEEIGPSLSPGGSVYYSCGMVPHCIYITKYLGWRCPRHGRKMQTLCRFVEGSRECTKVKAMPVVEEKGYVNEGSKFFITDDLQVYPSSKLLMLLQKLNIERMTILNSLDMFLGLEEILELVKASLMSTTVLQDVFGKVLQERSPRSMYRTYRYVKSRNFKRSWPSQDRWTKTKIRRLFPTTNGFAILVGRML